MTFRALLLACVLASGCGEVQRRTIHVLAAASLTEVADELAQRFEEESGRRVQLQFGASSALARQIEGGAPVDAFLSADARWPDHLIETGVADANSHEVFASNRLVLATSSERLLAQPLSFERFERVAVARAEVPAGARAREALATLGVLDRLEEQGRLLLASDVRAAIAWLERGEVDAAIVYATDVRSGSGVRLAQVFEEEQHRAIAYVAVAAVGSSEGRNFVRFLKSSFARERLRHAGFLVP